MYKMVLYSLGFIRRFNMKIFNFNTREDRNSALDIVRIVAVLSVVFVHFFLNAGFYSESQTGIEYVFLDILRSIAGVCVPLFLVLTGYLMNKRTISKKYYKGISKVLLIYLSSSIAALIFRYVFFNILHKGNNTIVKSPLTAFFEILNFKASPNSWYIEMYIGLFLIIPFLNLIWNNLDSKKKKQLLVLVAIFISILPTLTNIHVLTDLSWWSNPKLQMDTTKIIPDFFGTTYPITYYFVGCYLCEYQDELKIKTRTLVLMFISFATAFGAYHFYRSAGQQYDTGSYGYWNGFDPFILTVILFTILSRIKTDEFSKKTKHILHILSDMSLYVYLLSYIFDNSYYIVLNDNVTGFVNKVRFLPIMVILVYISSLLLAFIVEGLKNSIIILIKKIVKMLKSLTKEDRVFFFFVTGMIVIGIISLYKVFFGFGGSDESFYLTISDRLSKGASLFKDEWFLGQMFSIFIAPFLIVYKAMVGSYTGVILFMRIMYVILHALTCILAYNKLKKHGYIAVIGILSLFLFTPYNIMAICYNTMSIDFLVIASLLLATSKDKKFSVYISGAVFSFAVLCSPYLVIAYLLYLLTVVTLFIIGKVKDKEFNYIFNIKTFIKFTIGISVIAIVFLIFVLSKASIKDITTNIPYMLKDPEHVSIGFVNKVKLYFTTIFESHIAFSIAVIIFAAMLIVMIFDKNRKHHRTIYLSLACFMTILSYIGYIPELLHSTYNFIMYPMIFVGITSYILLKNKPKELFYTTFMVGILYSFCVSLGSNQYFFMISSASVITNLASFVFLGRLIVEIKNEPDKINYIKPMKVLSFSVIGLAICILFTLQTESKLNHCFWDNTVDALTDTITEGPAAGIKTNSQNAKTYNTLYKDVLYYNSKPEDKLLVLSEKQYLYLMINNFSYGTLSPWIQGGESQVAIDRLDQYYKIHPEMQPKYIYIPKESKWDFNSLIAHYSNMGYKVDEGAVSYKLEKQN